MGYERWAKVFNVKQMAQTYNYLREHGLLDYEELEARAAAATERYHTLSAQIKAAEGRMAEIAVLKPTSPTTPRPAMFTPDTARQATQKVSCGA